MGRGADYKNTFGWYEVKRDADLCLRPPIDKYGVLEFESIDQIVEAGYRYAQTKLEEMKISQSLSRFLGASSS